MLRCLKSNETRHYYDIAVIGYDNDAYSAWHGNLEGRTFVSPAELMANPFKVITENQEITTRRGSFTRVVEKPQWMEAKYGGGTYVHKAFDMALKMLNGWMRDHHNQNCYPPTIINITDGMFNGSTTEHVLQQANELKSMFTNDGNVILFNIHFTANKSDNEVVCPVSKSELNGNSYAEMLFDMSSLLPTRYNADIERSLNDNRQGRHVAMGINADASSLIKLMDIGTPTNIGK